MSKYCNYDDIMEDLKNTIWEKFFTNLVTQVATKLDMDVKLLREKIFCMLVNFKSVSQLNTHYGARAIRLQMVESFQLILSQHVKVYAELKGDISEASEKIQQTNPIFKKVFDDMRLLLIGLED